MSISVLRGITGKIVDLTTNVFGVLPIANGGTGASDAASARTNLGIKVIATKDIAGATTAYWDAVPYIQPDGVVEFGKYIDFHATASIATDYDVRLIATTGNIECSGSMSMQGVKSGTAPYKKGWRKLTATLPSSAGEVTIAHGITTIESINAKVMCKDGLIVFNWHADTARQFYIHQNGANLIIGVQSGATQLFGQTITIYAGEEL